MPGLPPRLAAFLDTYAIPAAVGVLVTVATRLLERFPAVTDWTGLTPGFVQTLVVGCAVFLAGLLDLTYSNPLAPVRPAEAEA